jgi:hypothetical protein
VRSYLGAPLIDEDGTVLGTVCAIDPSPRSSAEHDGWGQRSLEAIKQVANELVIEIRARQRLDAVTAAAPGAVMITSSPGLEVLHANAAHEQLFGPVRQLGDPAALSFPDLSAVGVLAAMKQLEVTGDPVATTPVRLAGEGRTVLFAVVPTSVPGHRTATLTLGMLDTDAAHCTAAARELAANLVKLCK